MTRFTGKDVSRFWSHVEKTDGCWLWKSRSFTGNGYGGFGVTIDGVRRNIGAHRVSYELHNGHEPPPALDVMHSCDNRLCVNPTHLSVGTRSDNMRDAARKGRISTVGQRRKTHCIHGHEFAGDNVMILPNGNRKCRACYELFKLSLRNKDAERRAAQAIRSRP